MKLVLTVELVLVFGFAFGFASGNAIAHLRLTKNVNSNIGFLCLDFFHLRVQGFDHHLFSREIILKISEKVFSIKNFIKTLQTFPLKNNHSLKSH